MGEERTDEKFQRATLRDMRRWTGKTKLPRWRNEALWLSGETRRKNDEAAQSDDLIDGVKGDPH